MTTICVTLCCGETLAESNSGDSIRVSDPDSVAGVTLNEVSVTTDLVNHKIDQDVVIITKKMREGTKNTGELLGRIAGSFYNPFTTEITYQGSKNILLLVDGVEKDAAFIKNLRPDRFAKIKITHQPDGMYAEYDVVIDLETRPTYTGYEGLVETTAELSPGGRKRNDALLMASDNNVSLTYTREKMNIDFTGSYRFIDQGTDELFEKSYPLNGLTETTIKNPDGSPNKRTRVNRYNADMALDYDFSKNHSVSARVSVTPSSTRESFDYMLRREFSDSGHEELIHETQTSDTRGRIDLLAGVWYRGKISGWELNARMTYNLSDYKSYSDIFRSTGYHIDNDRDIKVEYVNGAVETGRLSSNKKWRFSLSENIIAVSYRQDRIGSGIRLSHSRDIRNRINASLQFVGNPTLSAGVNAGFTVVSNRFDGESATHVAPRLGARMMWTPSGNFTMRLNYTMDARYASLSNLQDYGQFTDSLIYTGGNPRLKPSLDHTVTLSTTLFGSLSAQAGYTRGSNYVDHFYRPAYGIIPSGAETYYTVSTPVNATRDEWNLVLTYSRPLGSHWFVAAVGGIKGYHARYKNFSSNRILPEYMWYVMYYTMNGTLQFVYLNNLLSIQAVTPQINQWQSMSNNMVSVTKTFFGGKLELMGQFSIPVTFRSGRWHGGLTSESYKVYFWGDNEVRARYNMGLMVRYRFNGGKSVKKYDRANSTVEI